MEKLQITEYTDPNTGLDEAEAAAAIKNEIEIRTTKSYKDIFLEHTFTFFNIVNFVLAGLVIYTGSWRNMLFMVTVLSNMAIGLFQEIRSKQVLDKLALLHQEKVKVLRGGSIKTLDLDEIALGDILILETGNEVPCDGVVISGECSVNESMLTGESDPIDKTKNSTLFSGSFVTAGKCRMQVVRVGEDNYMYSVLKEAKRSRRYPSMLRDSMQTIIKFSTIILIPVGLLLFFRAFFISKYPLNDSILSVVAAVVGMIPEGLVILTSIALALSSIKLARQDVLVQELYCIETLAHVDVLCLDKTGTITEGSMRVSGVHPYNNNTIRGIDQVLCDLYNSLDDDNVTARAIREYVRDIHPLHISSKNFPFSSDNKCAGAVFGDKTYLAGAYNFIFEHPDPKIEAKIRAYASEGTRVLCLAKAPRMKYLHKGDYELLGFVLIEDVIRRDARSTLEYFEEQDVQIKIISGDMPETVCAIAREAGVAGNGIDMSSIGKISEEELEEIMEKYTVFGRVSPEQKRDMIKALKATGHTVAMTGDGVNDVMALKEADCSIAMGSGTQAARSIASLVLLENQFEALPSILLEGRRVINNVQRSASLFLVKTMFSVGISILTVLWLSIYPFEPIQLTLVSTLGVGVPSFFLTLEPNYKRVQGDFLSNVIGRAMPGAISMISVVVLTKLLSDFLHMDFDAFSTVCTWLAGINSLWVLLIVCNPLTKIRQALLVTMTALFFGAILFYPEAFSMIDPTWEQVFYITIVGACIPFWLQFLRRFNWPKILYKMRIRT